MMSLEYIEMREVLMEFPPDEALLRAFRKLESDNQAHLQLESGVVLRRAIKMGLLGSG
jgi:hypothetical protein